MAQLRAHDSGEDCQVPSTRRKSSFTGEHQSQDDNCQHLRRTAAPHKDRSLGCPWRFHRGCVTSCVCWGSDIESGVESKPSAPKRDLVRSPRLLAGYALTRWRRSVLTKQETQAESRRIVIRYQRLYKTKLSKVVRHTATLKKLLKLSV